MCEMLNLYVPTKHVVTGPPVRGLHFAPGGEAQRQFRERFADESGIILSGSGSKGCLCGFDDWADPQACTPLPYGQVAVMQTEHPEKRRHRQVVRELACRVGATVILRMKKGSELRGTLTEFDTESEVGRVGGATVVAAQVLEVR